MHHRSNTVEHHDKRQAAFIRIMTIRNLERRFPSVADLEKVARRRLPKFLAQYLRYGMGKGDAVKRNRKDLDAIRLCPRYVTDPGLVSTETEILGCSYSMPYGVAPVGVGGLVWPRAPEALAAAAKTHRMPFVAGTFTFASLETIHSIAGDFAWFQLYTLNQTEFQEDILRRALAAGYSNLVVTVDVPARTRRDHDIRNGFSMPPRIFDLGQLWHMLRAPAWTWAFAIKALRSGFPEFENLKPYCPTHLSKREALGFQSEMISGSMTPQAFKVLRDRWPKQLVVKGILDPRDAACYRDLGADAIVVSNHGGRQLEAAPSAVSALPAIRREVGEDFPLMADGGVRTGQDICRMIAAGADFVLLGRAFYLATAAIGLDGADYVTALLKDELYCTMAQLGCCDVHELRGRLVEA